MGNVAPKKACIRWLTPTDMKQVLPIESASYEFPWREEEFVEHIKEKNVIPLVGISEPDVVGYVVYENHPTHIHILNLTVAHKHRKQGYGTMFIDKLKSKIGTGKKTQIKVYIRESSLDAQLFLKTAGFRAVEVCKAWFQDEIPGAEAKHEDSYLFVFQVKTES